MGPDLIWPKYFQLCLNASPVTSKTRFKQGKRDYQSFEREKNYQNTWAIGVVYLVLYEGNTDMHLCGYLLLCANVVLFTVCVHVYIYICGVPSSAIYMMLISYTISMKVGILVNTIWCN